MGEGEYWPVATPLCILRCCSFLCSNASHSKEMLFYLRLLGSKALAFPIRRQHCALVFIALRNGLEKQLSIPE